ncbi:MAG: hypothetical protein AB7L66_20935, partial [Gemmatimonadales bacterium]
EGKCLIQLTNKGGHPVVTLSSDGDIALQAKEQNRMHCKELVQIVDADAVRSVGGDDSVEAKGKATIVASMDLGLAGMNVAVKGQMNVESVAGAINTVKGAMVHLQPPGHMPKQINAKKATAKKLEVGQRKSPTKGARKQTTDPATPRS